MKKSLQVIAALSAMNIFLLAGCSTATTSKQDNMTHESKMMDDQKASMSDKEKMEKDKMSEDKDTMAHDDKMSDDKKESMNDKEMMHDQEKMNEGELAPDFELTDVNGKVHKLSDYRGKKVYIKMWASWCSICLAGLPEIDELSKTPSDEYEVLTIASPDYNGEQSKEDFLKWFEGIEYKNLKVLVDPNGTWAQKLNVRAYPTQVFIGSDGVLIQSRPGHMSNEDILNTLASFK